MAHRLVIQIMDTDGVLIRTLRVLDTDDNPDVQTFAQAVSDVVHDHFLSDE